VSALLLGGCAVVDHFRASPAGPTPDLSPPERLQLAINLLDQGYAKRARVELKEYAATLPDEKAKPESNMAANAEAAPSDSAPPSMMASRPATMSMASAMAAKPVAPAPPKVAKAEPLPAAPAPTFETSAEAWAAIRQNIDAGHFDTAIKVAELNHVSPDRVQAQLLASAYVANAKAVRRSNATQSGAQALTAGQLYLETADMPEQALDALEMAVEASPNDEHAKTLLASAKSKTIDIHYRDGVLALRRQDLDAAITAFDRVLAIDPENEKAQMSRAQAAKLKQALQSLM